MYIITGDKTKDDIEQEITKHIEERLDDSISYWEPKHTQFKMWYNEYRDFKEPIDDPFIGASNRSTSIISMTVDAIVPRVIEDLFDYDTPVYVLPVQQSSERIKDKITQFMNWDLETNRSLYTNIWDFVLNACIYGVSFCKNYFCTKRGYSEDPRFAYQIEGKIFTNPGPDGKEEVVQVNPMVSQMLSAQGIAFEVKEIIQKRLTWVKYAPVLENLPVDSVFTPPDATSIEDAWDNSCIFLKTFKTKDDLMRQVKYEKKQLYKNIDEAFIKELKKQSCDELSDSDSRTKKVPVYMAHLNIDVDDDGIEEKIVALYHKESGKLLGWEKYPYWHGKCPIVAGYIRSVPHKVCGIGIVESLYDLKGLLDDQFNADINNDKYYSSPIIMHTESAGYNKETCKFGPGRDWLLDSIADSAIRVLQMPNNPVNTRSRQQQILSLIQRRGLITDYSLNMRSTLAANQTAKGTEMMIEEGDISIRYLTKRMSVAISEIFQQRLDLYRQYWGHSDDLEVLEWVKTVVDSPDNPLKIDNIHLLKEKMRVYVTASKEDKLVEMQKAKFVLDMLGNDPILNQFPETLRAAKVNMLRSMGIRNPEELYPEIEQIRQLEVEIQKQAMQQVEAEKSEQNIAEAEQEGFKKQKYLLEEQGFNVG